MSLERDFFGRFRPTFGRLEAADLVYRGMFVESKGYERAMRIRLIEKYPKDRFPLSFIKANGGSAVRSARRMPQQLLEAMMEQWDSMIDQLFEKELDAYKVCPNCLEAVSAELDCCPHCGTQLPDHTAAIQICPHCGAKNKIFDLKCANCGKELEQFPGTNDESNQK